MSRLPEINVLGIGAWTDGLPDWASLRAFARGEGGRIEGAPKRPSPTMLPANERRRAPDSVLLALDVAQAACSAAGADPSELASVFTSTHGDLAITHYMCETLSGTPTDVSPTRFHNSVHNAAAGYWTIGVGCHQPATAISAFDASFGQGLIEAALQLACDTDRVLLVAYDSFAVGPVAHTSRSAGLFGFALVLGRADGLGNGTTLKLDLQQGSVPPAHGALIEAVAANAMGPAAVLAQALAGGDARCTLDAGNGSLLAIEIGHD
ncbi:beta-ketoacyl synthase chain length factor [Aquimonas sp.]|jgi:hypothetical protein|uniref:beta-ketoacyl synthase chain length factor n=1 Tax=Aquimonas sp. TaxID=1872588 RepID=UPI0037BE4AF4